MQGVNSSEGQWARSELNTDEAAAMRWNFRTRLIVGALLFSLLPSALMSIVNFEATGIEVSFVAPVSASRMDIERLARSKLAYVIAKKSAES